MQSQSTGDLFITPLVETITHRSSKKLKFELKEVYKLFEILILDQVEELDKNRIWMHSSDIQELFGLTDTTRHYIRIANYAYKVGSRNINPLAICLNKNQRAEIEEIITKSKYGVESVIIRPIYLTGQHHVLKSVVLKIEFQNLVKGQTFYELSKLHKICAKKFVGRIVNLSQIFKLKSKNKILATVQDLVCHPYERQQLPFGLINTDTKLTFENINSEKISIVNIVKDNILDYCEFTIFKKKTTLNTQVEVNETIFFIKDNVSTIISLDLIRDSIFQKFKFKPLFESLKSEFEIENQCFEILISEIKGNKSTHEKDHYKTCLYLNQNTQLNFVTYCNDLIITNNDRYIADLCSFKVKGVWNAPQNPLSSQRLQPWINVEELENEIIKQKEFVIGQNFKVKLSTGTYLVNVECAENYLKKTSILEIHSAARCKWSLNKETKITYTLEPYLNLKLVLNISTTNISHLSFEIIDHTDFNCFLITGRHGIDELLEVDLIEAVKREVKYPIVDGQTIEILIRDKPYLLKATNIEFANKVSLNEMDSLGTLTNNTMFTFNTCSENQVTIIPKKGNLVIGKLKDALKEIGLGGIQEQLDQLISNVIVHQDSGSDLELEPYDLKPVKGLILYGPPGTGKTTLARNLSKFLGCAAERITLVSGPEILDKYVGGSEKKIRELFSAAKNAQARFGDKSPLYAIVFDEFDAIASKRSESSNKWHNSVVDQLLAMVDGLLELNNILVIGITNQIESLDPAIKRPGRFEFHLEMGLPNEAGRLEIFEIYTQKLALNNRLGKDVNLKELAKDAKDFSGADIKGLVRLATSYPVGRIIKFRSLSENEKIDISEKKLAELKGVSSDDFKKALIEIKKTREKEKSAVPFGMYL